MSQQRALTDQKAKHILVCIKRSITSRLKDVTLPNYSDLMRHHLGLPCPALGSSAHEKPGPVGMGPEEGHQEDLSTGAPLLQRQDERIRVVQPGEERASKRLNCGLPELKGGFTQTFCKRRK